jgi:hypothetical protein
MTTEQFQEKQSQMSNEELISLAKEEISILCKTGGKSIKMSVPPSVKDTDMLICELIKRFSILVGQDAIEQDAIEQAKEMYLDSPLPHSYKRAVEFGIKWREKYGQELEQLDQNNLVTRGSTALVYKKETLEEFIEKTRLSRLEYCLKVNVLLWNLKNK